MSENPSFTRLLQNLEHLAQQSYPANIAEPIFDPQDEQASRKYASWQLEKILTFLPDFWYMLIY